MSTSSHRWYSRFGKRLFDLALTLPGTVAISPLMAVLALAVRMKLGSPVLFSQTRPGKGGHPFTLYKFRTMTDAVDDEGNLLPDEIRLTEFGDWLRRSSLDELPELLNVLKGEMSLVGPRPLLMQYLPRYSQRQFRRHETQPGITGWAQINGRNALSWPEKFELDLHYIENQSLAMDVKILIETFAKVFRQEGIRREGHATMPEFMGNDDQGEPLNKDEETSTMNED